MSNARGTTEEVIELDTIDTCGVRQMCCCCYGVNNTYVRRSRAERAIENKSILIWGFTCTYSPHRGGTQSLEIESQLSNV